MVKGLGEMVIIRNQQAAVLCTFVIMVFVEILCVLFVSGMQNGNVSFVVASYVASLSQVLDCQEIP